MKKMPSFRDYFKSQGVNLDQLYYCENKYEFKFYIETDNFYSLDGTPVANAEDLNKIFINISGDSKTFFKYNSIKSRFVYGSFEEKINKFMLKNAEFQGLGIFRIDNKQLNYQNLLKIENKINSLKNLETIK